MTHPTDPVAAMREACARKAHDSISDEGLDIMARVVAEQIRALPLPAAQPDPRDEALRLARAIIVALYERIDPFEVPTALNDAVPFALAAIDALKEK